MKKLALLAATILVVLSAFAASAAKAFPVWEYPWPCYAYQSGYITTANGHAYQCDFVGFGSSTGYAWVQLN